MSSKVYEVGNTIEFRNDGVDERMSGSIAEVLHSYPSGEIYAYRVLVGGAAGPGSTMNVKVEPAQIVDWEKVGQDAADALDRIHGRDRARSDLLSELLGRLEYYADHDGRIDYRSEFSQTRTTQPLSELIREFLDRRDSV